MTEVEVILVIEGLTTFPIQLVRPSKLQREIGVMQRIGIMMLFRSTMVVLIDGIEDAKYNRIAS